MSAAEWSAYTKALGILRTNGVWLRFYNYHANFKLQGHGGCYFLPWHRQFLFEFERELNKVSPGVSLPYWDWTKISPITGQRINEYFTIDPVWVRAGGASGYAPIPNGPFRAWTFGGETCIRGFKVNNRNFNVFGESFDFLSSEEMGYLIRGGDSFANFAIFLEAFHGIPHVAVGGSMSDTATSPLDPIFYSHHAFIDKVWRDWQNSGNGNAFGGYHSNPYRACSLNGEKLSPPEFGRTARQVLETISGCTTYAPSSLAGPSARFFNEERLLSRWSSGSSGSGSSNSALERGSSAERKRQRARIAYKKRFTPESYRSQVRRKVSTVDSMVRASHVTNLPEAEIQKAVAAFEALSLKLGVDIVRDKGVVAQSIPAIQAQGAFEMSESANSTSQSG
jgi:hypothetical protein